MVVLAPGEPGVPVTCCAEAGIDTHTRPHSKIVVEIKLRRALHVDPDILASPSSGGLFGERSDDRLSSMHRNREIPERCVALGHWEVRT